MKLGSSIRRRRGRERGSGTTARSVLIGVGVLALGLLGGYVVATELVFPTPDPPESLTEVPPLHGLTVEEAVETVREAGLVVAGVDSVRHPALAVGLVVGQSPVPGQQALPGDSLLLTMSLGPDERPVPDVLRVRSDRARAVLEATGFEVTVDSVESDAPRGAILTIDPEPGTELVLPGEVALTVSLGPPQVEMPDLLGLQEEEALTVVDSIGLAVSEVQTRFRFGLDQGTVIEQDPEPGTLLERGSAIRVVVGRRSGDSGNIRLRDSVEPGGINGDSPQDGQRNP